MNVGSRRQAAADPECSTTISAVILQRRRAVCGRAGAAEYQLYCYHNLYSLLKACMPVGVKVLFFIYLNVCEYVSVKVMCTCSVGLQVLRGQTVLHFTQVSHHYPLL